MRNDEGDMDQGVHKVLETLDKENPVKAIKASRARKDQLTATLGFQHYRSFDMAKETYKKMLVDTMVDNILEKFNLL